MVRYRVCERGCLKPNFSKGSLKPSSLGCVLCCNLGWEILSECWYQVLSCSHIFPVCAEQFVLPAHRGCLGSHCRTPFPWSPILCPPHHGMALSVRNNIWFSI